MFDAQTFIWTIYTFWVCFSRQVLPVRRAVPTPPLSLWSEAIPVHRLREEVCPQRSPVETPQSPPLSTKQQDRPLCKLTPRTPLWQTLMLRGEGGRRAGICVRQKREVGRRGEQKSRHLEKKSDSLANVCVYVQTCTRDVHSWYCDNLLGGEEKTVQTKTENCYLTQRPHRWNKLLVQCKFVGFTQIFSLIWRKLNYLLLRVFLHFEVLFIFIDWLCQKPYMNKSCIAKGFTTINIPHLKKKKNLLGIL